MNSEQMDAQAPTFQMCEGCQQLLLSPLPSYAGGPVHSGLCTYPGATVALQEGTEPQRPTCRLTEHSAGTHPSLLVCVAGFRHHPGCMPARHPGPPGLELGNSAFKAASPEAPAPDRRMRVTCTCVCVCEGRVLVLVCSSPGGFPDQCLRIAKKKSQKTKSNQRFFLGSP